MTPSLTFSLPRPDQRPCGSGGPGDGRRAIARGAAGAGEGRAPLRLTRAHPSRPARRPSTPAHTRARGRGDRAEAAAAPPAADPPAPAAPAAQSPGPGRRGSDSIRHPSAGWIPQPGRRSRRGLGMSVVKTPWGSQPVPHPAHHHFYEFDSTFGRNYESYGKPKPEWLGGGKKGKAKAFKMENK